MTLFHVNMSKLNTNLRYSSLKKKKKQGRNKNHPKQQQKKKKTNHKQGRNPKLTTTKNPTKTTSHSAKETQCIQFQEKQVKSQSGFAWVQLQAQRKLIPG